METLGAIWATDLYRALHLGTLLPVQRCKVKQVCGFVLQQTARLPFSFFCWGVSFVWVSPKTVWLPSGSPRKAAKPTSTAQPPPPERKEASSRFRRKPRYGSQRFKFQAWPNKQMLSTPEPRARGSGGWERGGVGTEGVLRNGVPMKGVHQRIQCIILP